MNRTRSANFKEAERIEGRQATGAAVLLKRMNNK